VPPLMSLPRPMVGAALSWSLLVSGLAVPQQPQLTELGSTDALFYASLLQRRVSHTTKAEAAVRSTRGADSSTCGLDKEVVKSDCGRVDMGSCGNACCVLDIQLGISPDAAYEALADFLQSGGDSGAYRLVPGEMPYDEHPADNLTSLDIPGGWKFIVQGKHTTSGRHYVDTLNFAIRRTSDGASIMRAFSISDLHGALGDAGQNYKTLAYLLEAIGADPETADMLYGCGLQSGEAALLQSGGSASKEFKAPGRAHFPMSWTALVSTSTCGMDGGVVDCDRPDMGSCGNACCALEVTLDKAPRVVYAAVAGFLKSGGVSESYALVPGEMPYNEHPADDLTSLDIEGGWKFVFQGTHTTAARHYVDTMNFNIRSGNGNSSILKAFSISDLHGALGDQGQNFKSLVWLLDALQIDRSGVKVLHGCPAA